MQKQRVLGARCCCGRMKPMKQFSRSKEIEAEYATDMAQIWLVSSLLLDCDRSAKHAWYGLVAPLPHSEVTTQWACRVFCEKNTCKLILVPF